MGQREKIRVKHKEKNVGEGEEHTGISMWQVLKYAGLWPQRLRRETVRESSIWRNKDLDFSKLINDIKPNIQRALRIPSRINTKEITPKHILLKVLKVKDKDNLKSSHSNKIHRTPRSNRDSRRLNVGSGSQKTRNKVFEVLVECNSQPKVLRENPSKAKAK